MEDEEQNVGKIDWARLLKMTPQQYAAQQTESAMVNAIYNAYEENPEEFEEYKTFFVDRDKLKQFLEQASMAQHIIEQQQQQIQALQQEALKFREVYLKAMASKKGKED